MGKALEGVKILDFTHVQSGPTCTQLLAWFGADVIKVERPGVGDITRGQLQDVPNADSLYFTMLNHNKRSITIDSKNKKGMEILERLVKTCDVLVENFAPGALDRMGLTWERIQQLNPRMIYARVKGFGPGPYEDCKVYENVAQCTGGVGLHHRLPRGPAARHRRADRRQRHRPASGARHRHGPLPPHHDAARASASAAPCRTACSTWRASRCATSSASRTAPEGIQPVRRGHPVRQGRAARRQRLRRRPARPHPQVQGLGDRSRRLHLFHHAGARLGGDLRRHRRARLEDRSQLRQAAGPPAAPERDLRAASSSGP